MLELTSINFKTYIGEFDGTSHSLNKARYLHYNKNPNLYASFFTQYYQNLQNQIYYGQLYLAAQGQAGVYSYTVQQPGIYQVYGAGGSGAGGSGAGSGQIGQDLYGSAGQQQNIQGQQQYQNSIQNQLPSQNITQNQNQAVQTPGLFQTFKNIFGI